MNDILNGILIVFIMGFPVAVTAGKKLEEKRKKIKEKERYKNKQLKK